MSTTITTASRPRFRSAPVLALVLCIGAVAIPPSAGAYYGSVSQSDQPAAAQDTDTGLVIPDHTALNESLAPAAGSSNPGSIETPSPTPVIDTAAVDGFDWGDAALGAGITMALIAVAGAAGLTLRRHGAVSPSAG